MTYFANGTDAEIYQANYCVRCQHFNQQPSDSSLGCPVLNLHFDHNRDEEWKVYLDELIPPAPAPTWHGECAFFAEVNMVPDRLYQPPTPEWIVLLREAQYELSELARECKDYADEALNWDAHSYVVDDPEHECGADCPTGQGYHTTGMWLHQMWALDEVRKIDDYLAKHGQALDPAAKEQ